MLIGRITMAVVCVIGVIAMKPADFHPSIFFYKVSVILLTALVWSYIVEELASRYKKKKNAIRIGDENF